MLPDEVRLQHMLDAAQKAVRYSQGRSRNDLEADELLALALVRLMEIIGEAAKNVSSMTRDEAPQIPWRQITGTRDRLIHGYFAVDLDVLWVIITQDLPPLIADLRTFCRSDRTKCSPPITFKASFDVCCPTCNILLMTPIDDSLDDAALVAIVTRGNEHLGDARSRH